MGKSGKADVRFPKVPPSLRTDFCRQFPLQGSDMATCQKDTHTVNIIGVDYQAPTTHETRMLFTATQSRSEHRLLTATPLPPFFVIFLIEFWCPVSKGCMSSILDPSRYMSEVTTLITSTVENYRVSLQRRFKKACAICMLRDANRRVSVVPYPLHHLQPPF